MSAFYDRAAATALRLISDKGQTLALQRIISTFDPVTGAQTSPIVTSGNIKCVVLPVQASQLPQGSSDRIIEALTQGKLRKLIIAATGVPFEPAPNDVVTLDGYRWELIGVTPLSPGGTPIIYTTFIERGSVTSADSAALG